MRLFDPLKSFASRLFSESVGEPERPILEGPEAVVWPGTDASLEQHVKFIIDAKKYISEHDVPEDRKDFNNQYSHAGKSPIYPEDRSRPALTNCCYEHFGRKVVSFGFPLFIEQAPLFKDDGLNHAFSGSILWESFSELMNRYDVNPKNDSLKAGYYLPTNHYYMESKASEEKALGAEEIIEFATRTDITDPNDFISALDQRMAAIGYAPVTNKEDALEANA